VLGMLSFGFPLVLARLNPDQSVRTPIEELVPTRWIEPVSNPETEVSPEETDWASVLGYQFRYKLRLGYEFERTLYAGGSSIVLLDRQGSVHGFNAYTGLNHWMIPLQVSRLIDVMPDQKKLYLLEQSALRGLRLSVLDEQNPALLWQRTIPRAKDGALELDAESQAVIVSAGVSGVWALRTKTGEVLWKRPELYSKTRAIAAGRYVLVMEPRGKSQTGTWHVLDPTTGRTLKRASHSIQDGGSLERVLLPELFALGQAGLDEVFLLRAEGLLEAWRFKAESPARIAPVVDRDHYFYLGENRLLERRKIPDNRLYWQRAMAPVKNPKISVSPDGKIFAFPSEEEGVNRAVNFYGVEDGAYLAQARVSEGIQDWVFLGDWLYLISENHLWAFRGR
jgi:outer membrane protein assembly factor BamB